MTTSKTPSVRIDYTVKGPAPDLISQRAAIKKYMTLPQIWDTEQIAANTRAYMETHPATAAHVKHLRNLQANPQNKKSDPWSRNELKDLMDQARFVLAQCGFVCIKKNHCPNIDHSEFLRWPDTARTHEMWAHPLGVLASCDSYGDVYGHEGINAIHLHTVVDIGMGRLAMLGAHRVSGGSSNYTFLPHGGHAYSTSIHLNNHVSGVLQSLNALQRAGKIIPFDRWPPDTLVSSVGTQDVVDPASLGIELQSDGKYHWKLDPAQDEWDQKQTIMKHAAELTYHTVQQWAQECDQNFPGLGSILNTQYLFGVKYGDKKKPYANMQRQFLRDQGVEFSEQYEQKTWHAHHFQPFDWRHCENALMGVERLADHALERYASATDQQLLAHWVMDVVLAKDVQWEQVNMNARTKSGVTLPMLLALQMVRTPECASKLHHVLRQASPDLIQQWSTHLDASGKTLHGQLITANFLTTYSSLRSPAFSTDVATCLDIMASKSDPQSWVVSSDRWSPSGQWLNQVIQNEGIGWKPFQKLLDLWRDRGARLTDDCTWVVPAHPKEAGRIIEASRIIQAPDVVSALDHTPEVSKDPQLLNIIMKEVLGDNIQAAPKRKVLKM